MVGSYPCVLCSPPALRHMQLLQRHALACPAVQLLQVLFAVVGARAGNVQPVQWRKQYRRVLLAS